MQVQDRSDSRRYIYCQKSSTTRFGAGEEWIEKIEEVTGRKVIDQL